MSDREPDAVRGCFGAVIILALLAGLCGFAAKFVWWCWH